MGTRRHDPDWQRHLQRRNDHRAGTLQVGSGGTTGSIGGTSSVSDSGVLAFDRSDGISFAPTISGSGGLLQMGAGTLTLTAATNAYTGPTVVNGGSLVGTAANISSAVTLANGANVTFNQATSGTLNIAVGGNGSFTKAGGGLLVLNTPATYQGLTKISGGTLQVNAPLGLPTLVHYSFDGTLGAIGNGASIPDSSGNGNNATMQGSSASYVAGKFGQAIQPNGCYVSAPSNPSINGLHAWTDSVWINVNSSYASSYGSGVLVATREMTPFGVSWSPTTAPPSAPRFRGPAAAGSVRASRVRPP